MYALGNTGATLYAGITGAEPVSTDWTASRKNSVFSRMSIINANVNFGMEEKYVGLLDSVLVEFSNVLFAGVVGTLFSPLVLF